MTSASLAAMSQKKTNGAKKLVSQIAIKAYFSGEAAGVRLANHEGEHRVYWQRGSGILTTR
jgi:phosphatidylinositol 4-kinase